MRTTQTTPQGKDTASQVDLYVSFELADKKWKLSLSDGPPRANMTCCTYPQEISEQRGRYEQEPSTQGFNARSAQFDRSARIARSP